MDPIAQKICIKTLAIRYPINPAPGNVSTQVNIIALTIPQFTEDNRFAAPTPMTAVVLHCVVLTGRLSSVDISRQIAPEVSAQNP